MPALTRASTPSSSVSPNASQQPKASDEAYAARIPRQKTKAKSSTTVATPAKPSSSPTMLRMKSVCAAGRKNSF